MPEKNSVSYQQILEKQRKALKMLAENLHQLYAEAGNDFHQLTLQEQEEDVHKYMDELANELWKYM